MRRLLFLLLGVVVQVFSQITLQKEQVVNGTYRLVYANSGYPYSIIEKAGHHVLSFSGTGDDLSFPTRSLFIALPPNSRPAISVSVAKQRELSSEGLELAAPLTKSFFQVKGYLWIENYYCVHIQINPFISANNKIVEVTEFRVEIKTGANIKTALQKKTSQKISIIDNPVFGQQWKAVQPVYAIQATDSWIDYNREYVKLGVAKDGIYRIRHDDLVAFGISPVSVNPKLLKIFLKGKEIPIYVSGQDDNSFDESDYIEFLGRRNYGDIRYRQVNPFGTSYYEYLNLYSDTTVYWLSWEGTEGIRVDTILLASGTSPDTIRYYDELVHKESDVYWDFSLSGGDLRRNYPELLENETWQEGTLGVGTFSATFTVAGLFPNKPARAFVKLQDFASSLTTNAHNLALSINSAPARYDSGFINKYQIKTLAADFLSSALINGTNTVRIHSFTVPGNSVNTVIRDWYELEYPRYLRTTADSLSFAYNNLSSPALSIVAISGISASTVSLYKFKISDNSVIKITNHVRSADTLRFIDTLANGNYYFLLREDKIPTPIFFYKKKFVNLRNSENKADYIAVTHPYFQSAAVDYVSFIAGKYGVETKLVSIFDICDEYNYGFWSPEPIKEFLKSTHVYWQSPKPKYVLLLGKGTYDYYGNKYKYAGVPRVPNFVPPYGNPVSDVWFVQWDTTGSLIPQMNIGRIPAKSIDEFQSYYSKHQKYVTKGFDEWNKRFLFFSGGDITDPGQLAQAKGVNDFIIDNYVLPSPIGGSVANFYKTADPVTNFGPYSAEYITNEIEQGGVFISYIGHSGTQTWDNSITNVSQLANIRDRNPMISDFGCSTAKHAEPDVLSFSELSVNSAEGQAIAYIGNSSLGFTSTAYTFPKFFYKKLLIDTSASLGDLHRLAKIDFIQQFGSSGSYGLFAQTNSLIGDPIVKLPIPTKPNYSFNNSRVAVSPERATDQVDSVSVTVYFYNFGSVPSDSLSIQMKDTYLGADIVSLVIRKKISLFIDSLTVAVPIKQKPGEHTVTVTLDYQNLYDEIDENDNSLVYSFVVASTTIRNLTLTPLNNQTTGQLTFLNPSVQAVQNYFTAEVSLTEDFSQHQSYNIPYDTFYTTLNLGSALKGERVWVRTKHNGANSEGLAYSYIVGETDNIAYTDSISFSGMHLNELKTINETIVLDTTKVVFSSISAGANDGNTAVISKNGQNFIPENTLRGFHVCVFDASNYQFKWYYLFNVQANASVAANFKTFLDTLASGYLVIIAIANDVSSNAALLTSALKSSIKQYGSIYIDSVKDADSWTIIGRKGAVAGSVPEKYLKRYNGQAATIDTTILIPNLNGTFQTEQVGHVATWNDIRLKYNSFTAGDITVSLLGVRQNNQLDTLISNAEADTVISLAQVNAVQYPKIFISGSLRREQGASSPSISSLEINYDALPELGTNYQAVHSYLLQNNTVVKELASADSVLQGERVRFTYRIYNAGGSTAKNVGSKIISLWENNYSEQIAGFVVDSLPPLSYKELSAEYNTALGSGRRNIQFLIDADTSVKELYKDNNLFVLPIFVEKNEALPVLPNLSITQEKITPLTFPINDQTDIAEFSIVYQNTGAVVNDSISISFKHLYQNSLSTEWSVRRKYPAVNDTVVVQLPILRRAGEHQLQVELDPVGLVTETSELDNAAAYYFTVTTTSFKIIQPNQFTTSSFPQMLFLNPTETANAASRVALLELDSSADYSTAAVHQIPMMEFTSSYNIEALAKGKRYYWRIKEQGSTRDWTTGTFFLGTDSNYALGQSDSAGWGDNTFVHTAYYSSTGAQIVDSKYFIEVMSGGFNDGRTGFATVNGINVISPVLGTGHNIAVLDTLDFAAMELKRFDVSNNPAESDSLEQFVSSIPAGRIVIDLIVDDGSNNLQQSARNALKTIGSAYIDQVGWRDSWSIIGRKGAPPGSVPESHRLQSTGAAAAESTITKKEYSGTVTTPLLGVVSGLTNFTLQSAIPGGTELRTRLIGYRSSGNVDTVQLLPAVNTLSTHSVNSTTENYSNAKLLFEFNTTGQSTPSVKSWSFGLVQPSELGVSAKGTSLDRTQVLEGEDITFNSTIYNLGIASVESSVTLLKLSRLGISTPLQETILPKIPGGDSIKYSFNFNTRGKKGDYVFIFEVLLRDSVNEINRNNNGVTLPFTILADSAKPQITISFDGMEIVNGDYVSQYPDVRIRYTDNNPSQLLPADTNNFKIRLNNELVHFMPGTAEFVDISAGQAEIRWTPALPKGESVIEFYASDIAGNLSDTAVFYVNVDSDFKLLNVYNLPNPFNNTTHFTFNLAGPVMPDEVIIKLYTVAGRLIHEIHSFANVGFNKIFWDGRDKDGDEIGNGVYLYRVMVKGGDKQATATSKLVKMK